MRPVVARAGRRARQLRRTRIQAGVAAGDGDQRDRLVVEELHGQRVEVQVLLATAEQADDRHAAVAADDLQRGLVGRPRVGRQNHQVDAAPAAEVVELGVQIRIVGHERLVRAHGARRVQADVAVAQRHRAGAEQRPQRHRSQAQGAEPDHRHRLARAEQRLVVAERAQRIEIAVHGILGIGAVRDLRRILAGLHDVHRLVPGAGDHPVADRQVLHRAPHPAHDAEVAVADPARVVGRTGDPFGALVVAAVGADLQSAHRRLHPHLVRRQVVGVEGVLLHAQVAGSVEDGSLVGGHCEDSSELSSARCACRRSACLRLPMWSFR